MEDVNHAISALSEANERPELYERAAETVEELLGPDRARILVDTTEGLRVHTPGGHSSEDLPITGIQRQVQECLQAGEARTISGLSERTAEGGEFPFETVHVLPLSGRVALVVAWTDTHSMSDQDRSVLGILSTYLTERIENLQSRDERGQPAPRPEALLDMADILVVALDRDGLVTYVNTTAADLLGYDAGELVGKNWFDTCIPERNRSDVRSTFQGLIEDGSDSLEEYRNPVATRRGNERIVNWRNTTYHDDTGQISGTLSTGVDVTARERLRGAYREERYKYRTLVEHFPNGIVTLFDENHRYQLVGGDGLENLSLSDDELVGQRLEEVFPEANAERLAPLYDAAFRGESNTVEVTLQEHVFRVLIVPVYGDEGRIIAGMTMSQDVTEEVEQTRELERARKRYETLLHAAPDPIIAADVETGRIIEVNDATTDLLGQPRDEIVGLHQSDLHPPDQRDIYRSLFEQHVEEGGTKRRLPNGDQIVVSTQTGTVPVEISVATIELADRPVIFGVFHDISEQLQYERTLTRLSIASREFFETQSIKELRQRLLEAAPDLLDLSAAKIYTHDKDDGRLRVFDTINIEAELEANKPGERPDAVERLIWDVFTAGGLLRISDRVGDDERSQLRGLPEHGVIASVGDVGVLVLGAERPGSITDQGREVLDILILAAETAADRITREQRLTEHSQELEQRTHQLEHVESINAKIRDVAEVIVDSDSRREIEQTVCDKLLQDEAFDLVWMGRIDLVDNRLAPRSRAGSEMGYLNQIDLSITESATEPSVRAFRSGAPVVISNTAAEMTDEAWRGEAVSRGFRSAMSIPLTYQNRANGVLTIYSSEKSAFSGLIRSVLTELSELIAHGFAAIDRRQALVSNQTTELEFEITDPRCFFLRFAQDTGADLELEGMIPQAEDTWLVFIRVTDGSPERLVERAEASPEIRNARLLEANGDTLIQLRFVESFIASILADQGISVKNILAEDASCRITVAVPPTFDPREVVEVVSSNYPDSELLAKRERSYSLDTDEPFSARALHRLTPRQREVVELAYLSGYFESPKRTGAETLADELGFSTSAFHQHLRRAERKLFEVIFDE